MDDYNESGIPEWDKEFEEFWKSLLQKEGIYDENLIKNEMHDLVFIYKQVAEVYCHITGGQLSKPMYYASVIKSFYDENISDNQDIIDLIPELVKACKLAIHELEIWRAENNCECEPEGHVCGLSRLLSSIEFIKDKITEAEKLI